MANSILNGKVPSNGEAPAFGPNGQPNMAMLQQFNNFRKNFKGNPQQAVMQMLSQGKINNSQLQQAMQMARQFKTMIK